MTIGTRGISVVICAFNSANRIRPTLEALSRCESDFSVEIIVVDNNSSDDTGRVATKIWKTVGNPSFAFSVVHEARAGLSYARRAGVRSASYEVIVFCDDDNWLDKDYLQHALRIMADRSVAAAGGCSTPTDPQRLPPWFYTFAWGYAVGVPFDKIALLPDEMSTECPVSAVWGAGVVVRREVLDLLFGVPGFPTLTGRQGSALISGEDIEMSAALSCAGYKQIFSSALKFQHDIAPDRLDTAYARKLFANFPTGFKVSGYYRRISEALDHPLKASLKGVGRIAKHALMGTLTRSSFLEVIAAAHLPMFLTGDQRRVYGIVRCLRAFRSSAMHSEDANEMRLRLYAPPS